MPHVLTGRGPARIGTMGVREGREVVRVLIEAEVAHRRSPLLGERDQVREADELVR